MALSVDQPCNYQTVLKLTKPFKDGRRIVLAELAVHTGTSQALAEALKVEFEKARRVPELEILKAFFPQEHYLKAEYFVRKVQIEYLEDIKGEQ